MKKVSIYLIVFVIIMSLVGATNISIASTMYSPQEGDLIKTAQNPAVYYIDSNGNRRLFVNNVTFWTWYRGLWSDQNIIIVSQSDFDDLQIGPNITARSGVNLIKFQNSPRVYAVTPGAVLREVISSDGDEVVAKKLYGDDYANRLIIIQNSFENDYIYGDSLNLSSQLPDGSIFKYDQKDDVYIVENSQKRKIESNVFEGGNFKEESIIIVDTSVEFEEGEIVDENKDIETINTLPIRTNSNTTGSVLGNNNPLNSTSTDILIDVNTTNTSTTTVIDSTKTTNTPLSGSAPGSGSGNNTVTNNYIITFNDNTDSRNTFSQVVTANTMARLTANTFTRSGYTFIGWATTTNGVAVYTDNTDYNMGANNVNLYAKWAINSPSSLSYTSINEFVINTAISPILPTVSGQVDSYSIEPDLPTGLILNEENGQITGTPTVSTERTIYTITATNESGSVTTDISIMVYGTINLGGYTWLDRNLGADRVAISPTDYKAYGSLFQWGRKADGHQLINWLKSGPSTWSGDIISIPVNDVTTVKSDNPNHSNFIGINSDYNSLENDNNDWRITQDHTLWDTGSSNNPCPTGWHIPTIEQWEEVVGWSDRIITNANDAFSLLKLTLAGNRHNYGLAPDTLPGKNASYWSSTGTMLVHSLDGNYIAPIESSFMVTYWGWSKQIITYTVASRANGLSVRCIKD